MGWVDTELVLVALAAALSPTTLTFSVLALVLGDRPFRTGLLFWCGAVVATLGIGVLAAFVLGDTAASSDPSTPKTRVAILDIVLALWILAWVTRQLRKPRDPQRTAKMIDQMGKLASSPAIAVVAAGATLANPGAFIPIALKTISETDPSAQTYIAEWLFFTLASVLPLTIALVLLVVMRERALRILAASRAWLERNARTIAAVLVIALAASLLRAGIAGLVG